MMAVSLPAANAQKIDRRYYPDSVSIISPEPWLAPKYRSVVKPQRPNRTQRTVRRLRAIEARPVQPIRPMQVAPSFLSESRAPVTLPPPGLRQPAVPGAPPRIETYSDRVSRCVQYGTATGVSGSDMAVYTHSCAMQ
jgi:hypothetical protein